MAKLLWCSFRNAADPELPSCLFVASDSDLALATPRDYGHEFPVLNLKFWGIFRFSSCSAIFLPLRYKVNRKRGMFSCHISSTRIFREVTQSPQENTSS